MSTSNAIFSLFVVLLPLALRANSAPVDFPPSPPANMTECYLRGGVNALKKVVVKEIKYHSLNSGLDQNYTDFQRSLVSLVRQQNSTVDNRTALRLELVEAVTRQTLKNFCEVVAVQFDESINCQNQTDVMHIVSTLTIGAYLVDNLNSYLGPGDACDDEWPHRYICDPQLKDLLSEYLGS